MGARTGSENTTEVGFRVDSQVFSCRLLAQVYGSCQARRQVEGGVTAPDSGGGGGSKFKGILKARAGTSSPNCQGHRSSLRPHQGGDDEKNKKTNIGCVDTLTNLFQDLKTCSL